MPAKRTAKAKPKAKVKAKSPPRRPSLPDGVKVVKPPRSATLRKWLRGKDVTTAGGARTVHRGTKK